MQCDKLNIVWFGYFPWNDMLLQRKLQIKQFIPESDILIYGAGEQHFYDTNRLLWEKERRISIGATLESINYELFVLLTDRMQRDSILTLS
jgi:hypothetical protein